MAAAQDFGDAEMLGIAAAIAVAGYIGYKIYSGYQADRTAINNSVPGQVANAVGQAASNIASGDILTNNPISNWFSDLGTALSDPFGDSLTQGPPPAGSQ